MADAFHRSIEQSQERPSVRSQGRLAMQRSVKRIRFGGFAQESTVTGPVRFAGAWA